MTNHKRQWWLAGFHHYYGAIIGFIIAFILLAYNYATISVLIFILSLIMLIDDYVQHFIQTTRDPKYHSPLHKLYGYIYKYKIIQWLNRLADKLFGVDNNE